MADDLGVVCGARSGGVDSDYATTLLRTSLQSRRRFVLVPDARDAHAIVRISVTIPQVPVTSSDPESKFEIRGALPPSGIITLVSTDPEPRVLWSRAYAATRGTGGYEVPTMRTNLSRVIPRLGLSLLRAAGPAPGSVPR